MVFPLYLMLFASREEELMSNMAVRLDNWINLKMEEVW